MKAFVFFMASCLVIISSYTKADVLEPAVQIQFMPEIKGLYITLTSIEYSQNNPVSDSDEKTVQEKYGLYSIRSLATPDEKKNKWTLHPLEKSFELNGKKMVVVVNPVPFNYNPNGRCGAQVSANLTFIVNGKTILDSCPLSINSCDKEEVKHSKCTGGIYYAIGDDMLVEKNDIELLSEKYTKKGKKNE